MKYSFYLDNFPLGKPVAVFRGPEVFNPVVLERAMPDGSWSRAEEHVRYLVNRYLKGDFDPEDDEISEAQAMAQIEEWNASRTWPGKATW